MQRKKTPEIKLFREVMVPSITVTWCPGWHPEVLHSSITFPYGWKLDVQQATAEGCGDWKCVPVQELCWEPL